MIWSMLHLFTMSKSPTYSGPEKGPHVPDEKKVAYSSDVPIYAVETNGLAEEVEFGEVKELR